YALGVGFCSTADDAKELAYAYESPALKTVPAFASMLPPADFLADCGWNPARVLLAGLRLDLYRPLPAAAELLANRQVLDVYDNGKALGAMIVIQSDLRLAKDD